MMKLNKAGAGIALTFDDGPNPEHTPALLDLLDELQVQAHFFVVGRAVDKHPHLAQDMYDRGHILCNHSYTHPRLTTLSRTEQAEEIDRCSEAISKITGEAPIWFRPPYFDHDDELLKMVKDRGMHSVFCEIRSRDTQDMANKQSVLESLRETQVEDGVILCHEWSEPSREALRVWVPEIKQQYAFGALALD